MLCCVQPSRPDNHPALPPPTGLSLVQSGTMVPAPAQDTTPITGFPQGSWINYVSW